MKYARKITRNDFDKEIDKINPEITILVEGIKDKAG